MRREGVGKTPTMSRQGRQNELKEESQDGTREDNMNKATPIKTLQIPVTNRMGANPRGGESKADIKCFNAFAHRIRGPDQIRRISHRLGRRRRRATLAKEKLRKTSEARPKGDEKSCYRYEKVSN